MTQYSGRFCGVVFCLGLTLILSRPVISAQEGEGNVIPVGGDATDAPLASPSTPMPTYVVPTSYSGKPMKAFGAKNKSGTKEKEARQEFDVLPPMQGTSKKKKKGWFSRRKARRASQPKTKVVKKTSVVAPSPRQPVQAAPVLPAPNTAATVSPPTSFSGKPLKAFGAKNQTGEKEKEAQQAFDVLPPIPAALTKE